MSKQVVDLRALYELIRDDARAGEWHKAGMRLIGKVDKPLKMLVAEFDVDVFEATKLATPYTRLAQELMERYDVVHQAAQIERQTAAHMLRSADPSVEMIERVRLLGAQMLAVFDENIDRYSVGNFDAATVNLTALERLLKNAAWAYTELLVVQTYMQEKEEATADRLREKYPVHLMQALCEAFNLLPDYRYLAGYLHSL